MRYAYRQFFSFLTFEKFLNDNRIGSVSSGWHLQGWQDVENRIPVYGGPQIHPDIRAIFFAPCAGDLPKGDVE